MAVIFKNLMNRLGHKKYYVQGGDWGAVIGSSMATLFQNEVLGYHSNMLVVQVRKTDVYGTIILKLNVLTIDSLRR